MATSRTTKAARIAPRRSPRKPKPSMKAKLYNARLPTTRPSRASPLITPPTSSTPAANSASSRTRILPHPSDVDAPTQVPTSASDADAPVIEEQAQLYVPRQPQRVDIGRNDHVAVPFNPYHHLLLPDAVVSWQAFNYFDVPFNNAFADPTHFGQTSGPNPYTQTIWHEPVPPFKPGGLLELLYSKD